MQYADERGMHIERVRWLGKKQTPLGLELWWWVTMFVTIPGTAGAGDTGHTWVTSSPTPETLDMRGGEIYRIVLLSASSCYMLSLFSRWGWGCYEPELFEFTWAIRLFKSLHCQHNLNMRTRNLSWLLRDQIFLTCSGEYLKCGFCVSFPRVKVGPRPL